MKTVVRKKWYHHLLRGVYNFLGSRQGYSGCGICGDSWWWKKNHTISTGYHGGIFPFCEECHLMASRDQKHKAIIDLGNLWASQIPLRDCDQISLNRAHQAVDDE